MTTRHLTTICCAVLLSTSAVANPGDPLTTLSEVPMGISTTSQWFVGINEETVGTKSVFKVAAFTGPKWKKARTKFKRYIVDTRDPETEEKTRAAAEKGRLSVDKKLATKQVVEATLLKGGHMGRFRHYQTGLTVFSKKNQIVAHAGDIADIKQTILVKNTASLVKGKCKRGTLSTKIKHVSFKSEWKAASIYLELVCTPGSTRDKQRRSRLLIVRSLSSIL